jgi:predicted GIY-YIG superfamily endonuclease
MPFSVYMLRCADGSYYVGHTENLKHRMAMHERGEIPGHTADLRPLDLVWTESFSSRAEAITRERQVKGWSPGRGRR